VYYAFREKVKSCNQIFTAWTRQGPKSSSRGSIVGPPVRRMTRRATTTPWPRAAVFDCDGLLVDSADCWQRAYHTVVRERGREVDGFDLNLLAGASVAIAAERLSRELRVAVDDSSLRRALLDCFASHPPPELPGARALITALSARIPLAVASNAPRELVLGVLDRLGVRGAFRAVISAEQTAAHKPAPDVYLEACRQLRVAPSDAIAFEDSPLGAQAAHAAGLLVIAVPSAPGMRIKADLTARHLADPQLLDYLGITLSREAALGPRPPSDR
jgi:HAD superfamily hydrolase (TIGR01509 family)